jgi:hypothetical protein
MYEMFENTKGVIRSHKLKKDRQYNGQNKKDKRTNNDVQKTTHKTKDCFVLYKCEIITLASFKNID